MSTLRYRPRAGWIKPAWLSLLAAGGIGVTALALRGRAGAEGIPASEPVHYSGELTENGNPVDDIRPVLLVLWSSATATDAASKKCETSAPSTTFVRGSFRVPLPTVCVAQIRSTPDLWIETVVGGKSLGRQKVGAAPFAVAAEHAVSATRASEAAGPLEARLAALEQKLATLSQGLGNLVQTGTVSAGMGTPGWTLLTGTGERSIRLPVKFPQPFQRPPAVTVSISQLDILNTANARLEVSALEVNAAGFTAVFKTWADAQVYYANLSWTAFQK